jgi:hypothetical protein
MLPPSLDASYTIKNDEGTATATAIVELLTGTKEFRGDKQSSDTIGVSSMLLCDSSNTTHLSLAMEIKEKAR